MSEERGVVVDTSALVDAADARHPDWGEAFTYLHGTYPVQAPLLLASEAGNVVHHKLPDTFGEDLEERSRLLETLLEGIEIIPRDEGSLERAGELAEAHQLTFYDAEFLELADRFMGRILLTQDTRLLEAGEARLGSGRCLSLQDAADRITGGEL